MNFEQALRLGGLFPRDIIADGKWRRCPTEDHPRKKNGAYVLHPDGRGFFKNWAVDTDMNAWRDESATFKPVDHARIKAMRDKERAQRIQSMRSARTYWNNSHQLSRPHPYLERKGLTPLGCGGLRINDGMLVVPVVNGDWLVSVQTITFDGEKRFWPGAPVKGGAFVLKRERAALTCLCEGLATGLAVYQSVRNATVIVAFDSGNLLPVVDRVRPTGSVVICADNDHKTFARRGFNPGLDAAAKAAELIGCGVAHPQGLEGSDFADALREWGDGAARKVERLVLAGSRYVSTAVT
jgi:putative DNA primase/helicase